MKRFLFKLLTLSILSTVSLSIYLPHSHAQTPLRYVAPNSLPSFKLTNAEQLDQIFDFLPEPIQHLRHDYQIIADIVDDYDNEHVVIRPIIHGVELLEYEILIHLDSLGNITSINGELDRPKLTLTNSPTLPIALARQNALKTLDISIENSEFQVDPTYTESNAFLYIDLETQLFVYKFYITKHADNADYEVIVNAENGDIVRQAKTSSDPISRQKRRIQSSNKNGTGMFNEEYDVITTQFDDDVYLTGDVEGTLLTTYTMNNKTLGYTIAKNQDGLFNDDSQKIVVQAHHNMSEVLKFFAKEFNWFSYNGHFADVDVIVGYTDNGDDLDNAMFDGQKFLFGSGDKSLSYNNAIALDIVAHEFTHGVNANTNGLVYENQSGALDESIADVFGFFIDPEDYLIGEDLLREGADASLVVRSLEDPMQYGQPNHVDHYVDSPKNEDGDYGNVHLNAGIPNHAAYLITKEIGVNNAKKLYFYAIQNYLVPYSEFSDMRIALQLAAEVLFEHDDTILKSINTAWDTVGVVE